MFTDLRRLFKLGIFLFLIGAAAGVFIFAIVVIYYGKDLPDYGYLQDYRPSTTSRLYASNGQMLAEYAKEKRVFVPIKAIPKKITHAFLAAEDQNFYDHMGIDFVALARAVVQNISNIGSNKGLVGGSTITQQVVKNFLLTNERSFERKIKEAILAFRISSKLSKDRILELYLNEIYLGNRSYGVAAAALNYFNKSVVEVRIEEAALLAALPKAPSQLDPAKYPERAKARRNWVIDRMVLEGFIQKEEAELAQSKPITLEKRAKSEIVNTGFFADTVKKELINRYGEEELLSGGLAVMTTLRPDMQLAAEKALRKGLLSYDKRHGWRGPLSQINVLSAVEPWQEKLAAYKPPVAIGSWDVAVVLEVNKSEAKIGLKDGMTGTIALKDMKWARKFINQSATGGAVKAVSSVLNRDDVIAVRALEKEGHFALEQIPNVNGGIVALDPYTGRVLAMVGGYFYGGSQFNRVVQAKRQPGSVFKPFVYLAALEQGFAPNSIVVDEEIQFYQGRNLPTWRPQNHSGKYYGPTTLRVGLEKSRNTMTVRLAEQVGIEKIMEMTKRLGISDKPQRNFAMVLGSMEATLLDVTNAYATLANGGKRVKPYMIERVVNQDGKIIARHDQRACQGCKVKAESSLLWVEPPLVVDEREQIADPISVYQVTSMLEGVITRGTGTRAASLGRFLAGKTGTTNKSVDAWFVGYSSQLAVGVYVGFDQPRTLGRGEYGASAALPIWKEFMAYALKKIPNIPFRRPSGMKMVRVDAKTGLLPSADTPPKRVIYEAFRLGTEPTSYSSDTYLSDFMIDAQSPFSYDENGEVDDESGIPSLTTPRQPDNSVFEDFGDSGIY